MKEEKWDYLRNAFVLLWVADGRGRWLANTATFPALGLRRQPYGALLNLTSAQLGTAGASCLLHLRGWSWKREMNQML